MKFKLHEEFLKEGVAQDNPYLRRGIELWLRDPDAKALIVSVKPYTGRYKGKDIEVNKLVYNRAKLSDLIKELRSKWGDKLDISAIYNKDQLKYYDVYNEVVKKLKTEKNPRPVEKSKQVHNTKQEIQNEYIKIVRAFANAKFDIASLFEDQVDDEGNHHKKPSKLLKQLRKDLFN